MPGAQCSRWKAAVSARPIAASSPGKGRNFRDGYGVRDTTCEFQARARRPAERTLAARVWLRACSFEMALLQGGCDYATRFWGFPPARRRPAINGAAACGNATVGPPSHDPAPTERG
eukprot:4807201-Alexandrium_andersonii.AAC.1